MTTHVGFASVFLSSALGDALDERVKCRVLIRRCQEKTAVLTWLMMSVFCFPVRIGVVRRRLRALLRTGVVVDTKKVGSPALSAAVPSHTPVTFVLRE